VNPFTTAPTPRRRDACGEIPAPGLLQHDVHRQDVELIIAVLGPRRRVVLRVERLLFAVGNGLDPARRDPVRNQVLLGGDGSAIAEREIVLLRSAFVTVPGDPDAHVQVVQQYWDFVVQELLVPGSNCGLIEIEVNQRSELRFQLFRAPVELGERVRAPRLICAMAELAFAHRLPDAGRYIEAVERRLSRWAAAGEAEWSSETVRADQLAELRGVGLPTRLISLVNRAARFLRGRAA